MLFFLTATHQVLTEEITALHDLCQWCDHSYHLAHEWRRATDGFQIFGDNDGFVLKQDDRILIVFAGTKNLTDLATDLHFTTTKWNHPTLKHTMPGKAHAGFHKRVKKIYPKLELLLEQYANLNLPYSFVGHSLGGALAQMSALCFIMKHRNHLITVTDFGCPKIFDYEASLNLEQSVPHTRVQIEGIASRDPVTLLPPKSLSKTCHGQCLTYSLPISGDVRHITYHRLSTYLEALNTLIGCIDT